MRKLIEVQNVREGKLTPIEIDGLSLLAARDGERFFACENRCPHLGWSLARGRVEGCIVRCPWHGSTFDLKTGENLDWTTSFAGVPMPRWTHSLISLGKRPAPLRIVKVSVVDGWLTTDDL